MPYVNTPFSLVSEPSNFLKTDSLYGYALNEGSFNVSINGHPFSCKHKSNENRFVTDQAKADSLPRIYLFGCSFAYGFGVNDSATLASQLQKKLEKKAKVLSYAVPGFGDLQGYLKLKKMIGQGKKPSVAIFCYCDFHNERNILSSKYRIHVAQGLHDMSDSSSCFPMCKIESDSLLTHKILGTEIYSHWTGRDVSAIINLLQTTYDVLFYQNNGKKETLALYNEITTLCKANDIAFVFAPLSNETNYTVFEEMILKKELIVSDPKVNLSNPEYNNSPFDSHPNEQALKEMADNIYNTLLNSNTIRLND